MAGPSTRAKHPVALGLLRTHSDWCDKGISHAFRPGSLENAGKAPAFCMRASAPVDNQGLASRRPKSCLLLVFLLFSKRQPRCMRLRVWLRVAAAPPLAPSASGTPTRFEVAVWVLAVDIATEHRTALSRPSAMASILLVSRPTVFLLDRISDPVSPQKVSVGRIC